MSKIETETAVHHPNNMSWMQGLAHFLNQEKKVEALLVDIDNKKIAVATLGAVNKEELEYRLRSTLMGIENAIKDGGILGNIEDMKRICIRPMPGQTLLEKHTCLTAPLLWVWRDIEWYQPPEKDEHEHHDWKFLAFLAAICGVSGSTGWLVENYTQLPPWVSLSLFIVSMISGGWEAAIDVLKSIPKGKLDIHFLMLAVAVGATLIGAWKEGALLLFLFSFSGALEHFALHKTHQSIDKLLKVAPKTASIVGVDGHLIDTPIQEVQVGQKIFIKPGDLFPVDAEIISGQTAVDESNITGESVPIAKNIADCVYSGTLNLWGAITAQVLRPAKESALQKIIRLIQDAQRLKAKSQVFTDRFGTPYTYAILATTTVMFLIWWLGMGLEPFVNKPGYYSAFYRAMTLLVVASPCALVLSIPSAILAAIAWGASQGILFRGGAAIEKLADVRTVALDKTGTLTTGDLEVYAVDSFPEGQEDAVLALAYSLEKNANHPIARAIIKFAKSKGVQSEEVKNFQSLVGHGITGHTPNGHCVLGRRELLNMGPLQEWIKTIPYPAEGFSEVWVVQEGTLGRILLKDTIRSQSKGVLDVLNAKGIKTVMLTGDNSATAQAVGYQLGITEVRSGLTPEQKVKAIMELSANDTKVAFVGDGVNDAPSLAAAYVSVAMGARGSDAALEQSQIVLMHDRIENFLEAYDLSLSAKKIIYQNLFISLATIIVMVLSASFGLIPLTIGVFAHEGSTVVVCLNSLRLLFKKPKYRSLFS